MFHALIVLAGNQGYPQTDVDETAGQASLHSAANLIGKVGLVADILSKGFGTDKN